MKEFEDLNRLERDVLLACCDATNFSLSAHVPMEAIRRRITKSQHRYFNKAFKELIKSGFIVKKPTGRSKTYCLSREGLRCGNIIDEEL